MRFEIAGVEDIGESSERVWRNLMDHLVVASCTPGLESVEAIDETHYTVTSAFGVGSVKLRFVMNVELSDIHPLERAHMSVRGQAPGSAMHAESGVALEPLGPAETRLSWTVAADVHGTAANIGARLLKGTAKRLAARMWKKFAKQAKQKVKKKAD